MTIFYVDATNGSDSNNGQGATSAWQSVAQVNAHRFEPGDQILFKAGDVYHEALIPKTSGTADQPITFGAYGDGPAPLFVGTVDLTHSGWSESAPGSHVWTADVPMADGRAPDGVYLNDVPQNFKVADAALVDQRGEWSWSHGKMAMWSETDPGAGSVDAQIENRMLKIQGVDNITVKDLHFTKAGEGIILYDTTGTKLINVETDHNYSNGLEIARSSDVTVEGGSYHDNGRITVWGNTGHGIVVRVGSSDNLIEGVKAYGNAEDGVQFGPDAGDHNTIRGSELYGNNEDGVDIKRGSQTIDDSSFHDNRMEGINVHDNAGTTTITDSIVSGLRHGLDVSEWANVISSGNIYHGAAKSAVRLFDLLGKSSSFVNDVFTVDDAGNPCIENDSPLAHLFDRISERLGFDWRHPDGDVATPGAPETDPVPDPDPEPDPEPGAANDILESGAGADTLDGGDGSDTVSYANSTAGVRVDLGAGTTRGGDAAGDHLTSIENLIGSALRDTLSGDGGDNALAGEDGNDTLNGEDGNDVLSGGAGNDNLSGGAGNDLLDGGAGADVLNSDAGDDTLSGGAGADRLKGGDGIDLLNGDDDNDQLWGDDGNDTVFGGAGNDRAFGGVGDDVLHGDIGNDRLSGDDGNDTIDGGDGNDRADGGDGNDYIDGGLGRDMLGGDAGDDTIIGGGDADTLQGGIGNDLLIGGDTGSQLFGGTGFDTLQGGAGNDRLFGGDDGDSLSGGAGSDTLRGEDGNDTIDGGAGRDVISGGAGNDVFVFAKGEIAGDTISDFRGNGADAGDELHFTGFSDHAELSNVGSHWTITDGDFVETFTLKGVATLSPDDFHFV
jgi:Ca2+-binding RTX toxin-like protein